MLYFANIACIYFLFTVCINDFCSSYFGCDIQNTSLYTTMGKHSELANIVGSCSAFCLFCQLQ